jgi:hypothetical protein
MDWSTWFQNVSAGVIGAASDARFRQPYEIQKLELQQLGQLGLYNEGQMMAGQQQGANMTWLLLGGAALVALLILKD